MANGICDALGTEILVPINLSVGASQVYVEDCIVCCRPNVNHVETDKVDMWVWAEPELSYLRLNTEVAAEQVPLVPALVNAPRKE